MKPVQAGLLLLVFFLVGCNSTTTPALLPISTVPITQQTRDSGNPLQSSTSGGEPRTSGYWLIWNSCAEANQAGTAHANGGRAAGWIIMDDLLADPGIFLGALKVETCNQGLYLLQRRNLQGVEMEQDPAYLLASQLLTTQLNLAAGSISCQAADQAVIAAQNLLLTLDFDGTKAFLGPPIDNPQVEEAGTLAELLGSYNTGSLCIP